MAATADFPPQAPPELLDVEAWGADPADPLLQPLPPVLDVDPELEFEPEPELPEAELPREAIFTGRPESHLRVSFLDNLVLTFPDWLIEGIVPSRGVTMIFAPSGAGKTWVVDDWAVHVAARKSWQGRPVMGGGVFYIAAEGAYALPERSLNAMQRAKVSPVDLPFAIQREAIVFNDAAAHLTLKAEDLRREFARRNHPPIALVVVDTYAECLLGSDSDGEVTTDWMRQFRTFLRLVAEPGPPAAGILIHHPGHQMQDRARGSSALPAGVDCGISLEPLQALDGAEPTAQGGTSLVLRCTKMRDGEPFPDIPLALQPGLLEVDGQVIHDPSGRPRTTLSVVPLEGEVAPRVRASAEEKREAKKRQAADARAAAKAAKMAKLREAVQAFLSKAGAAGASGKQVRDNVVGRTATIIEVLETLDRDDLVVYQGGKWFLKP